MKNEKRLEGQIAEATSISRSTVYRIIKKDNM
ncbi:helix-turn-helix domain-containing protein [Staphylococcus epidermidis]